MSENPIRLFLRELEEKRQHDQETYTDVPPEPDWGERKAQYHLTWEPSQLQPLPKPQPLEVVRAGIRSEIDRYVGSDDESLLLVRVPPGTGKTTISVWAAQALCQNRRILYAASRHDFYGDICNVPGYDPSLWYEWQPINEDTCRYVLEHLAWINRGYPGMHFCRQVCLQDKYINECPYREQKKRKERIIFGMHQHLITGMSISDYGLAFCDEMPIGAFLNQRRVPRTGILVPGATGVIGELFQRLYQIAQTHPAPVCGPKLMDYIGDILSDAYASMETLENSLPLAPAIYAPEQALDAPYWYIFDLLKALSPEYECYRNGWQDWIARVHISEQGIKMLARHKVNEKWEKGKLVCLDATGSTAMYRRLFDRDIIEYAPQVERPGHVYQIVRRLNGMSTTLSKPLSGGSKRLTKKGRQMLSVAEMIADQYVGRVAFVTFKGAEPEFQDAFGSDNVRHFGALRGTNDLESAEALVVCGGYCPPVSGVFDLAAALHPERMKPFAVRADDGTIDPPWCRRKIEYRMREPEVKTPWREVSGFWKDPDLAVVLEEYRRNELVQAMHRVRPNLKDSDVWLLTSIPTGEPLDAIYETPSDLPFTPRREKKHTKKGKPYYIGVSWEVWLKLRKWLDDTWGTVDYLTREDLAEQIGIKATTVQQQKWLWFLSEFYEGRDKQWTRWLERINRRNNWVLKSAQ